MREGSSSVVAASGREEYGLGRTGRESFEWDRTGEPGAGGLDSHRMGGEDCVHSS